MERRGGRPARGRHGPAPASQRVCPWVAQSGSAHAAPALVWGSTSRDSDRCATWAACRHLIAGAHQRPGDRPVARAPARAGSVWGRRRQQRVGPVARLSDRAESWASTADGTPNAERRAIPERPMVPTRSSIRRRRQICGTAREDTPHAPGVANDGEVGVGCQGSGQCEPSNPDTSRPIPMRHNSSPRIAGAGRSTPAWIPGAGRHDLAGSAGRCRRGSKRPYRALPLGTPPWAARLTRPPLSPSSRNLARPILGEAF